MRTALSLSPLFRQSVGFDRFNDLFESMSQTDDTSSNYPSYNIERYGDDDYKITMAVPGFTEQDINITVQNDRITVTGRVENKQISDEGQYLHRGITSRAFEHSFRLADYMKVGSAELKDGLLRIQLKREIPEEAKPRTIPINSNNDSMKTIEGKHNKKAG